MGDWLNPLNRIRIRAAVIKREKTVTLDDSRRLLLSYNNPGQVYIYPEYDLVPQGYFLISTIKDEMWIADLKK